MVTDRASGRSKGFGFVTFNNIRKIKRRRMVSILNILIGGVILVDLAKPRKPLIFDCLSKKLSKRWLHSLDTGREGFDERSKNSKEFIIKMILYIVLG